MGFFTAILITLYGAISIISLANLLTEENCERRRWYSPVFYIMLIIGIVGLVGFVVVAIGAGA